MELKFSKPSDSIYKYEEPGPNFATSNPTLVDPFERRNV